MAGSILDEGDNRAAIDPFGMRDVALQAADRHLAHRGRNAPVLIEANDVRSGFRAALAAGRKQDLPAIGRPSRSTGLSATAEKRDAFVRLTAVRWSRPHVVRHLAMR